MGTLTPQHIGRRSRGAARTGLIALLVAAAIVLTVAITLTVWDTAREAVELALEQGERELRVPMRPIRGETRVLLFALDGVGDDKLREMIAHGRMPNLARLVGEPQDDDVYAYAFAVPGALSIIPSTTMAAWASVFTGMPAGQTGAPGNEWFAREEMMMYAPAPVSVDETSQTIASFTEGFFGAAIRVPTLFELADVRAHVALMPVHRGADLLNVPALNDVAAAFARTAAGVVEDEATDRGLYGSLDSAAVDQLLESLDAHGVPDLQVVYLPGIDLYTHVAEPPRDEMARYLEEITDPDIGRILEAYERAGVLDQTYIVFTSDHGHTPVLKDDAHALGSEDETGPPALLEHAGFRMREMHLDVDDDDYQAVVAYQGAIAYVYLADRSMCPEPGQICSWMLPPRFEEDVLAVVRAFDRANRLGEGLPALEGTLDLILARPPRSPSEPALPFKVWDGERLISVEAYLASDPRPDFPDFAARLLDLGTGPYGHRAGDVLLLAKSGLGWPIEERYYFSRVYTSWHGSPEWQDSRIPILVAHPTRTGDAIRSQVMTCLPEEPSQLDITPLVLHLLGIDAMPCRATARGGDAALPGSALDSGQETVEVWTFEPP